MPPRWFRVPLGARIVAVVDVFDALSHDRPYREAWARDRVLAMIRDGRGTHFDHEVVDVFLDVCESIEDALPIAGASA